MVQISAVGGTFTPPLTSVAPNEPPRRTADQDSGWPVREPTPSEDSGGQSAGANSLVSNQDRTDRIDARAEAKQQAEEAADRRAEVERERSSRVDIRI
ncbi:MAG: hypothetical protein EXQ85_02960 [Alphaproteobacteria bacterium]|nr:hypothetical protein [Alphaproteobacteria bacterium]